MQIRSEKASRPFQTSLRQSLVIQGRVIGALLMREIITRYGRYNIGFLWLFVEPMLFLSIIMLVRGGLRSLPDSNISIIAFMFTGYSAYMLWHKAVNRCSRAITPNTSLLYHRNVRVLDIFAARLILEFSGVTIAVAVLGLALMALELLEAPNDLLGLCLAWVLLMWWGVGLGLVIGTITERSQVATKIWGILSLPLMIVSGVFYMVDWLPPEAQEIVLWFPMVHGTEMLRHAYFGDVIKTYEDPSYLVASSMIATLIGLLGLRNILREIGED